MAKKKKQTISVKQQLLVALGIVLLLMGFGLVIAWLDRDAIADRKSHEYADVTITGEPTCVPVKSGESQPAKGCVQGIKTSDGAYYAVEGNLTRAKDSVSKATGTLMPPPRGTIYNVVGVLNVR